MGPLFWSVKFKTKKWDVFSTIPTDFSVADKLRFRNMAKKFSASVEAENDSAHVPQTPDRPIPDSRDRRKCEL